MEAIAKCATISSQPANRRCKESSWRARIINR